MQKLKRTAISSSSTDARNEVFESPAWRISAGLGWTFGCFKHTALPFAWTASGSTSLESPWLSDTKRCWIVRMSVRSEEWASLLPSLIGHSKSCPDRQTTAESFGWISFSLLTWPSCRAAPTAKPLGMLDLLVVLAPATSSMKSTWVGRAWIVSLKIFQSSHRICSALRPDPMVNVCTLEALRNKWTPRPLVKVCWLSQYMRFRHRA